MAFNQSQWWALWSSQYTEAQTTKSVKKPKRALLLIGKRLRKCKGRCLLHIHGGTIVQTRTPLGALLQKSRGARDNGSGCKMGTKPKCWWTQKEKLTLTRFERITFRSGGERASRCATRPSTVVDGAFRICHFAC